VEEQLSFFELLTFKNIEIMEITSFILGVCVVIVLAMVVGTFVNYMSLKQLKEQLDTLERDVQNQLEAVIRDNNSLEKRILDYVDQLRNNNENSINELYRYIDSRMDKMQDKFSSNIASGVEVKKALDEVKDLNERLDKFIQNYQNI
jgi:DNA anti-recombination protein RmuC